jgi:hypothetical protein
MRFCGRVAKQPRSQDDFSSDLHPGPPGDAADSAGFHPRGGSREDSDPQRPDNLTQRGVIDLGVVATVHGDAIHSGDRAQMRPSQVDFQPVAGGLIERSRRLDDEHSRAPVPDNCAAAQIGVCVRGGLHLKRIHRPVLIGDPPAAPPDQPEAATVVEVPRIAGAACRNAR